MNPEETLEITLIVAFWANTVMAVCPLFIISGHITF